MLNFDVRKVLAVISVSYVQKRMRLLLTVALVVFSQQVSTFTLPRKVDEPFGGLLHTMVNIIYMLKWLKLSFHLFILLPCQLQLDQVHLACRTQFGDL